MMAGALWLRARPVLKQEIETMDQPVQAHSASNLPKGDIDEIAINTIRTLSMDAVQKAKSGHPGTPMGMAPVAYTLWQQCLRYDPGRSALAQPRPVRALGRPCLDAALRAAAPGAGRLGRRAQGQGPLRRHARRYPPIPPAVVGDAGASRIQADLPASRRRRGRWRRACPTASGWPWRSASWRTVTTSRASRCSTTTSTRCAAMAA